MISSESCSFQFIWVTWKSLKEIWDKMVHCAVQGFMVCSMVYLLRWCQVSENISFDLYLCYIPNRIWNFGQKIYLTWRTFDFFIFFCVWKKAELSDSACYSISNKLKHIVYKEMYVSKYLILNVFNSVFLSSSLKLDYLPKLFGYQNNILKWNKSNLES